MSLYPREWIALGVFVAIVGGLLWLCLVVAGLFVLVAVID